MNYRATVTEFVVENFLFGDGDRLEDETSFIGSGIVDSTGIMELVAFLEETYGIAVEDEEVIPENLDSLVQVVAFLERKMNGR
ncbi:MAG TPA: acyl carrier protein [Syntrophobacteraceae bacterium]|jgi:acyl carrier protein|nr:acyl carrier protein [Syntrophobacteraceae bacterium]